MFPLLQFSGIRRSVTAIACTAVMAITIGCGDLALSDAGANPLGESPPTAMTAPTPQETAADQRALNLPAQMTLAEKIALMYGKLYVAHAPDSNVLIEHHGISMLLIQDSPANAS
jgi:hypothetical protein